MTEKSHKSRGIPPVPEGQVCAARERETETDRQSQRRTESDRQTKTQRERDRQTERLYM